MRRTLLTGACAVLLAGPTVLGFFTGGYFDDPLAWAGLVAWTLVAISLMVSPAPLPRSAGALLAIGGLALFGGWTLASLAWAPIAGGAYHAGQRVLLYLGVLIAASRLLRGDRLQRLVEPGLAAGALIVVGYGLSERIVPGLLQFQHSVTAEGRLEQPLTYWNAMGELAALGLVLCARLTGDGTRAAWQRSAAAAAAAPLAMGLYLTFSRGALFAGAAGLVALVVLAPAREQLRGTVLTLAVGVLAAASAAPFRGITTLTGSLDTREQEGAIALGLLVVVAVLAAVVQRWLIHRPFGGTPRLPRRAPWIALGMICAGLAVAIAVGAKEQSRRPLGSGANRFATLQSDRYAYWDVALRAFAREPLRGVGAGGWSVYWLKWRKIPDFAQDAHSLPLQTAAELGVVGLALLAMFLAGFVVAVITAIRRVPVLAAGPIAAGVTYLAHTPLDWDWQMPALTVIAFVLGGAVLALSEESAVATAPAAPALDVHAPAPPVHAATSGGRR